ncbi:Ark1/Prk1 family protein kinase Ppk30 [Schizosaccharomyces pombe]|uniref:Serine/threonine-protein kinase ppk30 n=1 Tax=Schizosaccharomyces pombe (strain 972 / ATCC 24843) TaxID=284812 RepID=PPK30_SCHPO|nr:Ark1/Prk1 family protein kinase Ppk30 [Schizosaccharomyces pombe]O43066.1 RecName: Full=Serine/threonine-protein kinase ppk30 [Schizosaccharomyces pombe 972h-]CAA17045.1 Ark1/Prk1 family protein kinase Ppk30 [Schizosaccharomyces pombe]|eukprot:NP_596081.1 Ark1/Prk1 family protein kinase Ppk30 [Schizosaccharomyces pombe]
MTEVYSKAPATVGQVKLSNNGTSNKAYSVPKSPAPVRTDLFSKIPAGTKIQVGSHSVIIQRYLSEGGFSHVYLALLENEKPFVLKRIYVPDKTALQLVHGEIETMKRLKGHRHIVNYIDSSALYSKSENRYEVYLLMEFCAGGGLIDFMNTRLQHRLTEGEILKILADVCDAVAAMHYLDPPLIHRDLKIENVLLVAPNSYKLCDFGSACEPLAPATTPDTIMFLEQNIAAYTTPQYRAPEMIDINRRQGIDEKSDIWAIGVLAYKLCYYTTPFEQVGNSAILKASFSFPPFPRYSDRMKRFIATCLQEQPSHRPNIYQTLKEIMEMQGTPLKLPDVYGGVNASTYNPPRAPLQRTPSGSLTPLSSRPAHTSLPPIPTVQTTSSNVPPVNRPSLKSKSPSVSNILSNQLSPISSANNDVMARLQPKSPIPATKSYSATIQTPRSPSLRRADSTSHIIKVPHLPDTSVKTAKTGASEIDVLSRYPSVEEIDKITDKIEVSKPLRNSGPLAFKPFEKISANKQTDLLQNKPEALLDLENRFLPKPSPKPSEFSSSVGSKQNLSMDIPSVQNVSTKQKSTNDTDNSKLKINKPLTGGYAPLPSRPNRMNHSVLNEKSNKEFVRGPRVLPPIEVSSSKMAGLDIRKEPFTPAVPSAKSGLKKDQSSEVANKDVVSKNKDNIAILADREARPQLLLDDNNDSSSSSSEHLISFNNHTGNKILSRQTTSSSIDSNNVQSNIEFLKGLNATHARSTSQVSHTQRLQQSISTSLERVKSNTKKESNSPRQVSKLKRPIGASNKILSGKFGEAFKKFEFGGEKMSRRRKSETKKNLVSILPDTEVDEYPKASNEWIVESEELPQVHETINQYRKSCETQRSRKSHEGSNDLERQPSSPDTVHPGIKRSHFIRERVKQLLSDANKHHQSPSDSETDRTPDSSSIHLPHIERLNLFHTKSESLE